MGNRVIYRPVYDAEVEYLESDGNSFIDTGLKVSSELGILAHIQNYGDGHGWAFGGGNAGREKIFAFLPHGNSDESSLRYGTKNVSISSPLDKDVVYEFNNIDNHYILYVNSLTYTASNATFESDYNFYLFAANIGSSIGKSSGVRIYDFKIYQNSTLVRDFIPVRIGQIGYMYDKVTKQLFANKGTGNFVLGNDVSNAVIPQHRCVLYFGNQRSVGFERIYEEYEWLIGDGSAYIDVPRSNEVTDVIHFKVDTSNSGSENEIRGIFGNLKKGTEVNNTIHFVKYIGGYMACRAFNSGNEIRPVQYNVMSVDILMDSVKVNSDTYELNRGITALEGYSMPIFSRRRINADLTTNITDEIITASLAYFKIDNVLDLIPCTLTMDLPASMDANNIARTKGTSGMWDLVSDRFYGNVASSGTFKAVNLAEGVDYEVHQWLVGEIDTQGTMMQFKIGKNFEFKRRMYQGPNTGYFYGRGYSYYTNTSYYTLVIWETSSSSNVFTLRPPTSGEDITIESTTSKLTFNGTEVPSYCNSYNFIISSQINSGMKCATSSITVDGIERYIPVKLLRSIPSKYDANGIARQVGECGMYDTVNDKFYGNVASSGSFTVSND